MIVWEKRLTTRFENERWLWISKFMIRGTSHETVQLWDCFIKPHSLRTNVRNFIDKTN